MNKDDWKKIQKKIDQQYERKLKEVSDDAMNKLQAFQKEHKQLLEKTQYLLDNSQIKSRDDSLAQEEEDRQSFMTQQVQKDRNRFFSPMVKEKSYQDPLLEQKTDPAVIRQLHQEYQDTIVLGKNAVGEIFLVDILDKMHFLYEDRKLINKNKQLLSFLQKSKQNLLIASDLESFKTEQDDVSKNLFKIICAILNLQVNQRGHNYLDDKLLYTYLDAINFNRDDQELVLIDQLATIKSLINRKTYSLTDKQIRLIHHKFNNLAENREKTIFFNER